MPQFEETSTPNRKPDPLAGTISTVPANTGEVRIADRHYVTAPQLAVMLGVSVRTLCRWDAARIGPPKIKIGKLVLFDLAKLPEWLAASETGPVRTIGRRRQRGSRAKSH